MRRFPDWLMLRAKARSTGRALASYWFQVVVLAPMIVAGFYYVLEPNVVQAGGWLRQAAPGWTGADLLAAGFLLCAALTAAGLPSALRHGYALGSPEAYLEALPVSPDARFRGLLLGQFLRNVPAWVALAAAFHLAADPLGGGLLPPVSTGIVILQVAALQILTALALVRLGWFRPWRLLAVGLLVGAMCLWVRHEPLAGFLVAPMLAPASYFQTVMAGALEMDPGPRGWLSDWPAQAGTAAALIGLARTAYVRWRDSDVERAQAATGRVVFAFPGLDRVLQAKFGIEAGAQIARDLRLTLRGSTPAVWTCAAAAALFAAAMPTAVANSWVPEQWLPLLLMMLTGLATLSLSALAPALLQRNMASLWIEHASGVAPEQMLKARKYFALIVSIPAGLAGALAATMLPGGWGSDAYLAGRAALAWISVATMIGAVAFDIAAAPAVGLLLGGLISLGICGMYGFEQFWPIGLFMYAYLMHMLNERAEAAAAHTGEAA